MYICFLASGMYICCYFYPYVYVVMYMLYVYTYVCIYAYYVNVIMFIVLYMCVMFMCMSGGVLRGSWALASCTHDIYIMYNVCV